ncbi:MAG: BrnT family toxin [Amaricoccus sp.]
MEPLLRRRGSSLARHRIHFNVVTRFGWSAPAVYPERRHDYGEERLVGGRLCVLVYTPRDAARRIISPRKANRGEQAKNAAAVLAVLAGGRA